MGMWGCAVGVMDSGWKYDIRELSLNFSQVGCIHLCANTPAKGMNPPHL